MGFCEARLHHPVLVLLFYVAGVASLELYWVPKFHAVTFSNLSDSVLEAGELPRINPVTRQNEVRCLLVAGSGT